MQAGYLASELISRAMRESLNDGRSMREQLYAADQDLC